MALNHCLAMELKKPHRLYYGMSVNIGPTPCRLRQLITFFTRKSTRVVHFCHFKINHNVQISTKFTTDFNRKSFELKMIRDSKRNFTRRQRIQQWTKLMSTYSLHLWFTQHNAPQFMKCDKWNESNWKLLVYDTVRSKKRRTNERVLFIKPECYIKCKMWNWHACQLIGRCLCHRWTHCLDRESDDIFNRKTIKSASHCTQTISLVASLPTNCKTH